MTWTCWKNVATVGHWQQTGNISNLESRFQVQDGGETNHVCLHTQSCSDTEFKDDIKIKTFKFNHVTLRDFVGCATAKATWTQIKMLLQKKMNYSIVGIK